MAEPAFAIGELVKLVFALGVTIGLFYALALFMKRMQVGTGRSGSMITVLAAMPLGGKEKLWVVDVAGEKLVVGTSTGHVNCLHVLKRHGVELAEPGTQLSQALTESSDASPASFRRTSESSVIAANRDKTLDPAPRRGDASAEASAFSALLTRFTQWQKP